MNSGFEVLDRSEHAALEGALGDARGDYIYDLHMEDDPEVDNDLGFPGLYKAGFYWIVATF